MANDQRWEPTEAQIERAMAAAEGDIRKLAIAYLKAQNRARNYADAFDVLAALSETHASVANGDMSGAKAGLGEAERVLRRRKQERAETP